MQSNSGFDCECQIGYEGDCLSYFSVCLQKTKIVRKTKGDGFSCTEICNGDETISGENESGYRGCQTQTITGKTCQKWTSQSPHTHSNTPSNKPGKGLGAHNYCRNPDGSTNGIWCYTTDPNTRWEYCDPSLVILKSENDDV